MKRRTFIQLSTKLALLAPLANACNQPTQKITGSIIGASAAVGHMVRDQTFDTVISTEKIDTVIVGGGISGLSAARWLQKHHHNDFVILDLEKQMGGNAAFGSNAISAFPWGAHYVPVPNNNLPEYLSFLEECSVVTGYDKAGLPIINELFLCSDPQERLFINGQWQDGLIPQFGVPDEDAKQLQHFFALMQQFKTAIGKDGKEAFTIPIDKSSKDPVYTVLDTITMKQWLLAQQLTSPYLHWLVNYSTRDDFGTSHDSISAWAGIHYFAARKGKGANADSHDVITWPEGNGWLSKQLQKSSSNHARNNALVVKITQETNHLLITYMDVTTHQLKAIEAKHCIVASPQFVNARLLPNLTERNQLIHQHLSYTPWMVANITVDKINSKHGAGLSWDNVLYNSASLGYVVATHQLLQQTPAYNITYYLPLTEGATKTARKQAQQLSHADWVKLIVADLSTAHPDIANHISHVDVMVWGHAMAQPLPGLIHSPIRKQLQQSVGSIHFAHTDLAGISIFEEAFYQGIQAAQKIMAQKV